MKVHAQRIFDDIAKKNADTFNLLGAPLKDSYGFPFEPDRIYIPGNHDRLCTLFPGLQNRVRKALGLGAANQPFPHIFTDPHYGVIARHGHEFDKFNYEGGAALDHHAHMQVPIGDPITTELATKFPWRVMQAPKVKALPEKYRQRLEENLQQVDNVRPFSAVLQWLLYQVSQFRTLKPIIEDCLDEIVEDFNKLSFVKNWYKHHDRWTDFLDEADKIQAVLFLLEKFKVFSSEKILPLVDKAAGLFAKDELAEGAKKENPQFRYVVYGHTHTPIQRPIRVLQSHQDDGIRREQVYINTGTWRSRYHKAEEGADFIGWKNMTYAIFYTAEERGADIPSFETWTGTLKTS
jgi:UDP-2,3-diacylglucosamine pyrophosphatase LpxH